MFYLFLSILYFISFFRVVGEFDHCGPYSLLIRRLTIGPSEAKFLKK